MRLATWLISKQDYSELAMRIYGNGTIWRNVAKTRLKPPQDEESFRKWLWHLVKGHGPGYYAVTRTQEKGEGRGFHPVGFFYIDENHLVIKKKYKEVKSHAGLPSSRQLWYKRSHERKRFHNRGRKRFK